MSLAPEPPPAAPPARPALDLALRVAGGVVTVWAGLLAAVLDLLFATWAWAVVKGLSGGLAKAVVGTSLAVAGVAAAVVLTILLGWFARRAVGTRWAAALAALPWFVLILLAGLGTAEGDGALSGDNLVGVALIVAGAITFAVLGFQQLVAPPPAR